MKKNCLFSVLTQSRERGKVSVRLAMRQQTTFAPHIQKMARFSNAHDIDHCAKKCVACLAT
jgi:hypothetical protein